MAMAWRDENRRIDFFLFFFYSGTIYNIQLYRYKYFQGKSLLSFSKRASTFLAIFYYYYLFLLFRSLPIDLVGIQQIFVRKAET